MAMNIYHSPEKNIKKMKKLLKKVLTKGIWCGIISKSLRELRQTVIENWTTREKYKAKKIVCVLDLEQFKREYYSKQK